MSCSSNSIVPTDKAHVLTEAPDELASFTQHGTIIYGYAHAWFDPDYMQET